MYAKQDRRIRFLYRLGMAPDRIKTDKLAVILGGLFRPDFFHRFDLLAQDLPALLERRAVIFHLLSIPSTTNAKEQATIRQHIERRYFFRQLDGVMFDHQTDTTADLYRFGCSSCSHHGDEQVMCMPVIFRQLAA